VSNLKKDNRPTPAAWGLSMEIVAFVMLLRLGLFLGLFNCGHESRLVHAGKDLLVLNRCRMFLQAVTLSDITTADGISITPQSWAGI
jgi:hypothetical protein